MMNERIPLDENDENAFLEVFVAEKIEGFTRKAMLVIPGGGYQIIHNREAEPIAMAFIPYGFNSFILHYSICEKCKFPNQLVQASRAMKHIKDNAERYNIDPENVFAVGSSAGGHLAGCLGVWWDHKAVYEQIQMEYGYNKPKGIMLMYPVISSCDEFGHPACFRTLLVKKILVLRECKKQALKNILGKMQAQHI